VRRLALLAGLAATLIAAAACNSSTPGQPSAGGSVAGSPPPTSAAGGNALPVDQPCSLVSQSALSEIGESAPPTPDMVGTAHDCSLTTPDFSIGVAIRTDVGLSGFTTNGGTAQNLTIGTHQAKQELDSASGSCVIGIGVTDSSRVDVTVTPGATADPCPTASKLATAIEPKLP
jgi:uncharacterized protein DUF3558